MIILGVDPAIAKGKYIALVLCTIGHSRVCHFWTLRKLQAETERGRLEEWIETFRASVARCESLLQHPPDIVAIEDARGVGGSGFGLQFLVRALSQEAESLGLDVLLVNPKTAKEVQTGYGSADGERVSYFARQEFKMMDVEDSPSYDLGAALAVANAACYLIKQGGLNR